MTNAAIIGTGGHARVVASLLFSQRNKIEFVGFYDLEQIQTNEQILKYPNNGPITTELIKRFSYEKYFLYLAIGNNSERKKWYLKLKEYECITPNLIGEYVYIDQSAKIGDANIICNYSHIGPEAELSDNNLVNTRVTIEHESKLGSHNHLGPASTVAGRCKIFDEVFLGMNSAVIEKKSICSNVVIGAGATVINNITDSNSLYVGSPATRKK